MSPSEFRPSGSADAPSSVMQSDDTPATDFFDSASQAKGSSQGQSSGQAPIASEDLPISDEGPLTKPAGAVGGEGTVAWFPVAPSSDLGRYELDKFHARGGMGEIWLARDREIGREVALKRLRHERRPNARDRFLAEAQITGQLEHPGIVPVHDLGLDGDGRPYYVMKFVRGRTLKDALEEHHSPNRGSEGESLEHLRLLEIFVQACRAISYAHHRGVVHRDIKPDNIMLGPFGETLVLDWGLGKLLHVEEDDTLGYLPLSGVRASGDTHVGSVVGTAQYMAPELASGKPDEVDKRTDVYLLGATLFEIITGQPPRRGTSNQEMVELARSAPVVSPREVNKRAPKALAAICQKAMARRKQDRYSSVEALADDVQRYLAGEPVSAYRESLMQRAWRQAKRHRRTLARVAAAAALVGLAALSFVLWRESQSNRARDLARQQLKEFRELSDAAHGAVGIDDKNEIAHYYDLDRGLSRGREALAIAETWEKTLERYPLVEDRQRLEQELVELLLLIAQAEANGGNAADAKTALERIEWAEMILGEPSKATLRIRKLLGVSGAGALAASQNKKLVSSALDDFLDAEEHRRGSRPVAFAPVFDPFEDEPMQAANKAADPQVVQARAKLQTAVAAYQNALRKNPRHYWSHVQLGRCYLALGRRDEGIAELGAAVAIDPSNPWAYSARGLALAMDKQYGKARADFQRALAIDPQFAPALMNRGVAKLHEGKDRDKAIADLTAVLDLPENERLPEAAWYRGQAYMQNAADYERALADFAFAIKARPHLRDAHLRRAEIHLAQEANNAVLADLDGYIGDETATQSELHRLRARELRRLAKKSPWAEKVQKPALELALKELQAAPPLASEAGLTTAVYFDELGRVHIALDQAKQAIAAWDTAIAAAPADAAGLRAKLLDMRGWQHGNRIKKNKLNEAFQDFSDALPADEGLLAQIPWQVQGDLHLGKGFVYAIRGQADDARNEVSNFALLRLKNKSDHWILHHNAACIYAVLATHGATAENHDLAIHHLREAVHLSADDAKQQIKVEKWLPDEIKNRPEFQ